MKKYFYMMLLLLIMPMIVSANEIGEFKKTINISLNCEFCDDTIKKEATFQLFADGEIVEGQTITLNEANEFKGSFEDLDVFKEGTTEIAYEVKIKEGEEYKAIPEDQISYDKKQIKKWVQVMPEDIEPGHNYVLFTDNWNYENNGMGKFVLVSGDLYLEEIDVVPEYNIINGKKSYYTLVGEPSEESIWTTSAVAEDDAEYKVFKDYLTFNSYNDTKLSLAGYNYGGWMYFAYGLSDQEGYYLPDTYTYQTNKVEIVPIEGTIGRFFISSINTTGMGTYTVPNYISIDFYNNITAQTLPEWSAQFLAFEYVETETAESVYNMNIGMVLCEQKAIEEQKPEPNPNTSAGIVGIVLIVLISVTGLLVYAKQKKNYLS